MYSRIPQHTCSHLHLTSLCQHKSIGCPVQFEPRISKMSLAFKPTSSTKEILGTGLHRDGMYGFLSANRLPQQPWRSSRGTSCGCRGDIIGVEKEKRGRDYGRAALSREV